MDLSSNKSMREKVLLKFALMTKSRTLYKTRGAAARLLKMVHEGSFTKYRQKAIKVTLTGSGRNVLLCVKNQASRIVV